LNQKLPDRLHVLLFNNEHHTSIYFLQFGISPMHC